MNRRERLILEIQKHRELYDPEHEHYRDAFVRDRAWRDVGRKVGVNSEVAKRDWKILRDSLRQVSKKRRNVSSKHTLWRYERSMAFLLPFLTTRTPSNTSAVMSAMDQEYNMNDLKNIEKEEPTSEPVQSVQETSYEKQNVQYDDLELFFSSLCQSVRQLPGPMQTRLKRSLLDTVMVAVEENENMSLS